MLVIFFHTLVQCSIRLDYISSIVPFLHTISHSISFSTCSISPLSLNQYFFSFLYTYHYLTFSDSLPLFVQSLTIFPSSPSTPSPSFCCTFILLPFVSFFPLPFSFSLSLSCTYNLPFSLFIHQHMHTHTNTLIPHSFTHFHVLLVPLIRTYRPAK